jgi:hypothetical protein
MGKNGPTYLGLSRFLIPVVFLYGSFFLVSFFSEGFLALLSSTIMFLIGFTILPDEKASQENYRKVLKMVSRILPIIAAIYISSVLILITDWMKI